jgi:hypothetical protein
MGVRPSLHAARMATVKAKARGFQGRASVKRKKKKRHGKVPSAFEAFLKRGRGNSDQLRGMAKAGKPGKPSGRPY